MTEVTWKDTGLDQITDLRGKKVESGSAATSTSCSPR